MNKATPGEGLTHLGLGHWNRQRVHRKKTPWLPTLHGTLGLNFIFSNTSRCHNIWFWFSLKILPPPPLHRFSQRISTVPHRWLLPAQPCKRRASVGRCLFPRESYWAVLLQLLIPFLVLESSPGWRQVDYFHATQREWVYQNLAG